MDLHRIIGTAIVSMLTAEPTLTNIIGTNGIWLGASTAVGTVKYPYVTFGLLFGGSENLSPRSSFDTQAVITGISNDLSLGVELAGAIRTALMDKEPTYPAGYEPFAPVTELYPLMEQITIEGKKYWRIGAVYRFRGVVTP